MNNDSRTRIVTALVWCLTWGKKHNLSRTELSTLHQMRQALADERENESDRSHVVPDEMQHFVTLAQQLYDIDEDYKPKKLSELPKKLSELKDKYLDLWNEDTPIGLVYGGATKIKKYIFEAAKLPDIRGASALLDRINLVDLPAFFGDGQRSLSIEQWLDKNFPDLRKALIPELIIYSTGGSILAFCPAAFVDELANAIEKRYTDETLTANSCAVGDTFKLLEFRFGLLQDKIEDTFWFDQYEKNQDNPIIKAYFDQSEVKDPFERFQNRKNFNELVGKLANQFKQRRNGNNLHKKERPSRCYPPIFETHPYVQRDESDRRSAIMRVEFPNNSFLSEPLARKRLVGEIAKRKSSHAWYDNANLEWQPFDIWIPSWVNKFEEFLKKDNNQQLASRYYGKVDKKEVVEARSLREIASASTPSGFVAYIYADGNNMGGYIRQKIKTPQDYRLFSKDIFDATQESVYKALAEYLHPYQYTPDAKSSRTNKEPVWIHPFEIITIGGDDVLLVVPADKGLEIAKMIGDQFEDILCNTGRYSLEKTAPNLLAHRYTTGNVPPSKCLLSMSTGVLITAQDTPIYYADKLVNQLLKSAKKYAKELKKDHKYYGGTVDFLVMKAVTMISSNIKEFREQGLIKNKDGKSKLKLYASPYTLYELGGLIENVKAFKKAEFPRSQLYQIRSLLERGKRTAILNYRYFRIRLTNEEAKQKLEDKFELAWCRPKDASNHGNLAPWMSLQENNSQDAEQSKMTYETIWRELVDLYPFIAEKAESCTEQETTPEVKQ
ncbi:type III-B CRISPR-associated protein Cas10/Cmr2 [Fischerella thermalis CCMEE 5205]|nr:type III-B CRISPR-associated protein Cas10/Cmr2 [Fischerella thermalis CCMEE 5205]